MNIHDATESAYKRGYEDGKRDAVEAEKMEVLFIGIEQPDRAKDLYTFALDFELGGITYKYRENLTAELFENFGFEKVKHGRWVMRGGKRYCSECGQRACVTRDMEDFWYTVGTDYCPNCGARMDEIGDAE